MLAVEQLSKGALLNEHFSAVCGHSGDSGHQTLTRLQQTRRDTYTLWHTNTIPLNKDLKQGDIITRRLYES